MASALPNKRCFHLVLIQAQHSTKPRTRCDGFRSRGDKNFASTFARSKDNSRPRSISLLTQGGVMNKKPSRNRLFNISLMLFLLLILSIPALAQSTATLQGTVTDPKGDVMPNAK